MAKQKFYVVWKGRRTGVFNSWDACSAQVSGYPGAEYKSFESLPAAEAAFRGNYAEHKGKPSGSGGWLFAPNPPISPAVCVDAACSGSPGPLEYRGVMLDTGQDVFRQGPFADGTNNVGEFLAIVQALAWLKKQALAYPVYSDSQVAIGWVRAGKCRTQLARTSRNEPLFELVACAETWLAENSYANQLLKWDTEAWGEVPADYGRK